MAAITATAGGLIVSGTQDGSLLLFDAASGELLRTIYTGASIAGGNISYGVDGKQFLAVGAGTGMMTFSIPQMGRPRANSIIVYALP